MERRNDIVKLAAKKLSKILDVDILEAAHQVQQLETCKLGCLLSKMKNCINLNGLYFLKMFNQNPNQVHY